MKVFSPNSASRSISNAALSLLLTLSACYAEGDGAHVTLTLDASDAADANGAVTDTLDRAWHVETAQVALDAIALLACDSHERVAEIRFTTRETLAHTTHEGHHDADDYGEIDVDTVIDLVTATGHDSITLSPPATALCALQIELDEGDAITLNATSDEQSIERTVPGPLTLEVHADDPIVPSKTDAPALSLIFSLPRWLGAFDGDTETLTALHDSLRLTVTSPPQ